MGNPILLLHGAIGSSEQLKPLAASLAEKGFDPELFDFTGHGGREMPAADFSIPLFAEEVMAWMNQQHVQSIDIFGYSMGGYIALYLARHYPARVGRIMTLGTKLAWDIATSEKEVKMLDPDKIKEKVPRFAEALAKRHAPGDWKEVLHRTAAMMLAMGVHPPMHDEDFRAIDHEVQMLLGGEDSMVSKAETLHVQGLIRNARFELLNNTPHPIEQVNETMLCNALVDFFQKVP